MHLLPNTLRICEAQQSLGLWRSLTSLHQHLLCLWETAVQFSSVLGTTSGDGNDMSEFAKWWTRQTPVCLWSSTYWGNALICFLAERWIRRWIILDSSLGPVSVKQFVGAAQKWQINAAGGRKWDDLLRLVKFDSTICASKHGSAGVLYVELACSAVSALVKLALGMNVCVNGWSVSVCWPCDTLVTCSGCSPPIGQCPVTFKDRAV